ncbi:MAG: 50S ribosomal protein L18 [bacterium]|nr:50S ribosomal protein L18 [bacterium]
MDRNKLKNVRARRRKRRVRKRVRGTADQPRLTVSRSLRQIRAQLVDDDAGVTLCQAGSDSGDLRGSLKSGGNVAAAKVVGAALAAAAKEKGIARICFDRNGYMYHGRVKGLADAAREAGLEF